LVAVGRPVGGEGVDRGAPALVVVDLRLAQARLLGQAQERRLRLEAVGARRTRCAHHHGRRHDGRQRRPPHALAHAGLPHRSNPPVRGRQVTPPAPGALGSAGTDPSNNLDTSNQVDVPWIEVGTSPRAVKPMPPAFLQLAGHELRWRLLVELSRSDRRVHELTGLLDEPQNLVSYHLGKLRDAELVSSRRSSADRRDAYYSVDLARVRSLLAATGAALHPGIHLAPAPPGAAARGAVRARVLFLCTGNSARSQMAEALTRARSAGLVEAYSAGSRPRPLHPDAVRVMREEYGIDLSGQRSKHLDTFAEDRFDRVITLC